MQGVYDGLGGKEFVYDDPRNKLGAYLQQNVHAFSAAKSLYQLQHFAKLMTSEDGSIRDFTSFRNNVQDAGYLFNKTWLETEYNTALTSAEGIDLWHSFTDDEVLQISTVGDGRVRPEHAALDGFTAKKTNPVWRKIWIPFDFNCRCHIIPGLERNIKDFKTNDIVAKGNISKYFQSNPALSKIVFDEQLPMVKSVGQSKLNNLSAEKDYNMKSVQKLINDSSETAQGFNTNEAAKNWWDVTKSNSDYHIVTDITGLKIKITDTQAHHILDDNNDGRWGFFKEINEMLSSPDEVWTSKVKNEMQRNYVKYFDGLPLVARVNENNELFTFHSLLQPEKINNAEAGQLRKGILIHKKN